MATQASITFQELEFQLAHWNDDNGSLVITIATIFTVCAIIAVVLRLVTRRAVMKIAWQLDDDAIIIAMVLAVGLYIEVLLSVRYGTGKHVLRVGVDGAVKIIAITWALELTYNICLLFIKASLLLLYRTVLTLNNPRFKTAWYAVGAYVLAFTLASFLGTLLQCTPIHYGWDQLYGNMQGSCVDLKAQTIATAALNTLADVSLLVLPIPLIWNLQMPLKQRLGLCVIFLLGVFSCVASAVRIQYIAKVQGSHSFVDFTYIEVNTLIWSVIEPCVGIFCACLTTLRPMFRVLHIGNLRAKLSSRFKYGSSTRSALDGSEQVSSLTKEISASPRKGRVQHEFSETDHSTTVSYGMSDLEMRSMGYESFDTEKVTESV